MVEIGHHFFVGKYGIVLGTFFMKEGPIFTWLSWQRNIVWLEVSPIEEHSFEHWMVSVASLVGEEAFVLPTCLETIISSERSPPQHHRDVRMFGRSEPPRRKLNKNESLNL